MVGSRTSPVGKPLTLFYDIAKQRQLSMRKPTVSRAEIFNLGAHPVQLFDTEECILLAPVG